MAPVSSRCLGQSNNARHEDVRDYRSHIRSTERSRRDTHQESKRKRRSSSQSNDDGWQRRRITNESRHSSSNPLQIKRSRPSESRPNNEERKNFEQNSRKRILSKYQNHALVVKETIAKSFGISKSKLSRIMNDKCDQLIRNNIITETKVEIQHTKPLNEIESAVSSRSHTDEVHMQDQNLSLDDERFDEAPNNDYSQHFVNAGLRPQNFIRDAGLHDRFEEYPKLRELIRLKDEYIQKSNTGPMYLSCDILANNFTLASLECEFDVILIEPPLEEYKKTNGVHFDRYVNWDEVLKLDVETVAAQRSFVFLWCGSEEGLDQGRSCLKKWGFRRCEDICWVKTNRCNPRQPATLDSNFIFQRTKEHCLMGIRGTVRRSVDFDFIHANVDIDLIITEEPDWGDPNKPIELFHIIEHFCLGRRRLHLFARDSTIRRGWLSIGSEISTSNFDKQLYKSRFEAALPSMENLTERIEQLRPKSPPPKGLKLATTTSTNTVSTTVTNATTNPGSSSLNMSNTTNNGTSSTSKDSSASNILQEGQQAIRSTITSNRQSSARTTRPHWTLYPEELSNNNYPNMISSPNRHQFSSTYGDLHVLPEFDLSITGGGGSTQTDYENYYSHSGEPSEERNNFRS